MTGQPCPAHHECLILSCSPRAHGNSAAAAGLFLESLATHSPHNSRLFLELGGFRVAGCTGCGACGQWADAIAKDSCATLPAPEPDKKFLGCPLSLKDESSALLHALSRSAELCIISPIYFYHLPSQLKALLDRTQPFWEAWQRGIRFFAGERPCKIILLGARRQGVDLFKGSMLTLKYSLRNLGWSLGEPLLLYDLDGPTDLENNPQKKQQIKEYAQTPSHLTREGQPYCG